MKGIISMIDTHSRYDPPRPVTSLIRMEEKLWKWDPSYLDDSEKKLKCDPNIMNDKTLSEYIEMLQKLRDSRGPLQGIVLYEWERNIPDVQFEIRYSKIDDKYSLVINLLNKYNKDFVYGDKDVLAKFQMSDWDDNYLGTPESHGGFSGAEMTKENLEKYIQELIDEYEEVTGEKYVRS